MTFRALGRNHIVSTSLYDHHNALFLLNSRIPLVRSSSELVVLRTPRKNFSLWRKNPLNKNDRQFARFRLSPAFWASPKQLQENQFKFRNRLNAPNPQSQSFSRSYGSNLPTSLTYIFLSTRGYTPRRPDAVMSTTKSANKNLPRIFKGQRKRTRHPKNGMLYQPLALSPAKLIPRTSLL